VIIALLLALVVPEPTLTQFTRLSDGSGFFQLPDSIWVDPGSSFAVIDSDTFPAVSGASGSRIGLVVDPAPASGDSVTLVFRRLPLSVSNSGDLDLIPLERIPLSLPGGPGYMDVSDHGLYISGAKRLGLSVGDGGGMTQGTRISIEGMLTPGIHVSGSVTDENLPIGAGYSELLSELDRIIMRVEGERWAARLGDMDWVRDRSQWSALGWQREVSGVEVSGTPPGGISALAGYGSSGVSRARTVFYTEEGIQGPYEICAGAEVVAGSETVWLDGNRMTRGKTADYEIEYTSGLITFTSTRLIRRDQRVEVTYFRRGDGFRKELFAGDASWTTVRDGDDSLRVGFSGLVQSDNRNSPLGFVLTDEAINVLGSAGEDPMEAWINGATEVGEGNGSYSQDSLGHYVYEGLNSGNWRVVFQRPPQGSGDYVYDSAAGGYLWIGENEGSHLPRQYLEIPESHELGGLHVSSALGPVSAELEGTFSRRTGNLYNPDETTRSGSFVSGILSVSPWESGTSLKLSGRWISPGFRAAGEVDADSSLASWSLPPDYEYLDDLMVLSAGQEGLYSLSGGWRYAREGGMLERYGLGVTPRIGGFDASFRARYVSRNDVQNMMQGNALDVRGGLSRAIGKFTPMIGLLLFKESWSDSLNGILRSGEAGLSFESGFSRLQCMVELELDDRTSAISRPDRVWRYSLEGSGRPGRWGVTGSFEHSTSTWDEGGSSYADAIGLSASGSAGPLWLNAIYSGSGVISRSLEVIYVYVGEGQGNYSYDTETGEYYPDPGGDYDIYYQPGGEGETIVQADLALSFSSVSTESGLDGSLDLSSRNGSDRLETFLLFGAFQPGEPGGYTAELSPWWRWGYGLLRRFTLRGRLRDETIDYSGAGNRREREWLAEVSPEILPVEMLRIRSTGRIWMKREELYQPRETRGLRAEVDPVLIIGSGFEPGLAISIENRRETEQGLDETMYGLRPHASLSGGGWISNAQFTLGYIPGEGSLPTWFFDGSDRGISLGARMRIGKTVSQWLRLSLYYWGRRPAGSDWSQQGGLEGTVNF